MRQNDQVRGRIILLVSLGLNLALAAAWFTATRPAVIRANVRRRPLYTTNVFRPIRTNLIVQPQVFSWRDIESGDYPTYIQNLRAVGCPEATVRDIIVADVNQLFARRRATQVRTTTHQWWRSDPDMDLLQESSEKVQALERERRELLTRLLGPNWEVSTDLLGVADTSVTFDGPLLGELSAEVKLAVSEIERRSRQRHDEYRRAQQKEGQPVSRAELARFRQEAREDLAKVLTPAQLEEYLLRYSHNADQLRDSLRGFDATQEEFRKVFRAADPIDTQLELLAGGTDPAAQRRRQELEKQREQAIKEALGEERYPFFQLNRDPAFQQARDTAEQLGVAADAVLPLYQINQATDQERQRVLRDASLSPEEQSQELASIYQQQLDSLRKLLGAEAFKKLQSTLGR